MVLCIDHANRYLSPVLTSGYSGGLIVWKCHTIGYLLSTPILGREEIELLSQLKGLFECAVTISQEHVI
jgi:hypothetical protein